MYPLTPVAPVLLSYSLSSAGGGGNGVLLSRLWKVALAALARRTSTCG